MNAPTDNLENNPLYDYDGLPDFGRIGPEHVEPAMRAALDEARAELEAHEHQVEPTWESAVERVAEIFDAVDRAWSPASHLMAVANSDTLRNVYQAMQGEVVALGLRLQQSEPIYRALKALQASPGALDDTQRRIVDQKVLRAELTGIALTGTERERFNEIAARLSELSTAFSNNMLDSRRGWSLDLTDPATLEGTPATLRALLAQQYQRANPDDAQATVEDGPWRVTLDHPVMHPVMQHVRDRDVRRQVYQAYMTVASAGEQDNSALIPEILALRAEKSALLGYDNFAEVSLATKMASLDEVLELTDRMAVAARPAAERELAAIADLAAASGQAEPLEAWDVVFWRERLRESQFELRDEELRPYFPMPRVLDGLFSLIETLFGASIRLTDRDVPVWHPDVRYYEVWRDGDEIAGFYFDPYSRPENKRGGAWMGECQSRWAHAGGLRLPVAYIVCNATPPVGAQPALMTFDEVETLFHEFGHGLQHMLTTVDHVDAAGISGVEWDAVELPSQFMENWCYHRPTLLGMAKHWKTGETLPEHYVEKLRASRNFQAATFLARQLKLGMTDIALHSTYDPFDEAVSLNDIKRQVVAITQVQPLVDDDEFLCSFSHIFAGGYSAGSYSYKWAEVLSADAFGAFVEAGLDDDDAVARVGRTYRETVLALGGSLPPMDIYEKFRGRAPRPAALLEQYELAS